MRTLGKKGSFDTINAGMIGFISFVLIAVLVILLVSTVKQTDIVCPDTYRNGACLSCNEPFIVNSTNNICCNNTGSVLSCEPATNTTDANQGNAAYNATVNLQSAAQLPPQFAQIIVIVIIIVGILGMLAFVGYGAYQKMK